ncbi:MAG TPA: sigma-70 family RNA polymerase sigma factor [Acidimicrobiales bacterium]|nr:sigma-70 family RNA polymerase sigma factor [Acidimicrobiales bacterium]
MNGAKFAGRGGEDVQLIAAAQDGDRSALDRLLRQHYDRLYAVCRRLTGNDADAADATQEALLAVVRGLRAFDGRSKFTTWSYRVAVNASLDELRRRRRRPQTGAVDDLGATLETHSDVHGHAGADPATIVTASADIDDALATLSPEFRTAVVLRDLAGLDYAEIAEVLDIPPGTVRSRIARGRAALADLLRREP